MAKVAFIGLGNMGVGMAGCVLAAGHSLHLYNRTASRADSLVRQGARQYATPSEACAGADAVISMVADDPASRAVWTGPSGILSASTVPGAFAVECSTLSHDWVIELAAEVKAMIGEAVDAEAAFADDLLGQGVPGMTPADMRSYLEHVADRRLTQLGLPAVYGSPNPFTFLELQDVQELSNFFERRVSAYQVGVEGEVALDAAF